MIDTNESSEGAIKILDYQHYPGQSHCQRTEAGRLCQRLAEFYMEEKGNSPFLISIPKGANVPVIKANSLGNGAGKNPPPVKRPQAGKNFRANTVCR